MQIALIGYGKMGKMIEEVAVKRGHRISMRISSQNKDLFTKDNLVKTDIAIEFTAPQSAFENVKACIDFNIPVVSGSTGWNQQLPQIIKYCTEKSGSFLHASNFSIGVNIFFQINEKLAQLMSSHNDYDIIIKEIHHTQKKDAPSGTAVTIAEQILSLVKRKKQWVNDYPSRPEQLSIISERTDPAPGTHSVKYTSAIDDIEIIHTAHNRMGFAIGAVLAAEYIADKQGIFTMKDVLRL
jgi:4-hydroxy-tetrahydrodipicolinate reductase